MHQARKGASNLSLAAARRRPKAGESCAGKGELRRPGSDSRRVLVLCHAQPPHSLVRIGPGVNCV